MPLTLTASDVALRLVLAAVAGGVIGLNRERGHTAGLRTTLLVCLAAAIAMVQVNLLLPLSGKGPGNFNTLDLMRLPLGVLSGMGFIGAGAILRRGNKVRGITTAATLWFVTVMGLCFGAGQLALGLAAFALGAAILWALKPLERRMPEPRRARLVMVTAIDAGPTDAAVRLGLTAAGYVAHHRGVVVDARAGHRRVTWSVRWTASRGAEEAPPPVLAEWSRLPGAIRVTWEM